MTNLVKNILFLALVMCAKALSAQTHADGMAAMQLENWDKAISIYTALTKADATDQNAWLTLGNAYLAKGDKNKALETFQAAFNAKADGNLAYVANSRVLLLQNKMADADEQFKRAGSKGKKDITALRQIGESFLFYIFGSDKRPNLTRAEQLLKVAYEFNSKDFATLMALGYCYKEMGDGGKAAQFYEYATLIEPKNPLPLLMMAKVYKAAKIPVKFLEYIDKTLLVAPTYTPALRAKAEHFYFSRQWEKATEAYKELVKKGTEVSIEDEMQLANCLYISKDCKGCSELVEKILKKDGTKNYLRRLQGYCDYETGDFQRGLDILNDYFKVVTPEKVLPSDYEYLGRLQIKTKGDTLAAIGNLKKSIELDSSGWPKYKEIGDLFYARKDYCNAAIYYKMNLDSVAKPEPMEFYRLGTCHYYCRLDELRYQKADSAFAKVTEMVPTAGIGWLWRGKSNAKLEPDIAKNPELINEFGRAKPFFEKYVEIASVDKEKNKKDLISAFEYLTSYYFLKNDDVNSKLMLEKLLEIDPANKTGSDIKVILDGGTPTTPPTMTPVPSGGGGKG